MKAHATTPGNPGNSPSSIRMGYFLLVFLISILFLGRILWPFWSILVLSFLLTNIFRPMYMFFNNKMPEKMASILTCLLIILIVFIPLLFFVGALSSEALGLYHWGRNTQVGMKFQLFMQDSPMILQFQDYLQDFGFHFEPAQITAMFSYIAKMAGLFIYNQASSWAANILQFLFLFFMMILTIFFLLIDQDRLIKFVIAVSPLPDDEDRLLVTKFQEIANAILKGNGICGIIQGILGGAVFAIMGLSSPILWGGIMAILAFLPIFGIGLVMIPTAIVLVLSDSVGAGIFLFCFYLTLSFTIEYLVKPKMVGNEVQMHTLLVFLAIIGGLSVYGVLGIIYGPLIVTAFLTLTEIYLAKYDNPVQQR
ncbi:MAG: AI-2E family transporter [Thermodesulfobacteriota bacterium]|nr:AI-2E family transporter [Thermodesulfobacteriota bacterium]